MKKEDGETGTPKIMKTYDYPLHTVLLALNANT